MTFSEIMSYDKTKQDKLDNCQSDQWKAIA